MIVGRGKTTGIWRVELRRPRRRCGRFFLRATAEENGDKFTLVCVWADVVYVLTIHKNGPGQDDMVFARAIPEDQEVEKYVNQVLRIAGRNIEKQLARVDQKQKDGVLCRRI